MIRSHLLDRRAVGGLLRHVALVHHVPGRIRLRIGPALWRRASRLDHVRVQMLMKEARCGVLGMRLNPAAASLVVHYDTREIDPGDWEILLQGDVDQAGAVIDRWLSRCGHVLQPIQTTEE